MTEPTTETSEPKIETASAHPSPGRERKPPPSEDEIRALVITEYRDDDPPCAKLVRQIMDCHRLKRNSPQRHLIVEAIKAGKEWRRIAPTWEKFVHRALAWRGFSKSGDLWRIPGPEVAPEPVEAERVGHPVPVSGAATGIGQRDNKGQNVEDGEEVALAEIDLDCAIRVREKINQEVVDRYCELMKAGAKFPPIKVFRVNGVLKVADGQHRCRAAEKACLERFRAVVVEGTDQDALRAALGANAEHGLPRSNKDKRHVAMLGIQNFGHLSDREIASICQVSNTFIGEVRAELSTADSSKPRTGKDGKSRRPPARRKKSKEGSDQSDDPDSSPASSSPSSEGGEEESTGNNTVPQNAYPEPSKRETEDAADSSDAALEIPGHSGGSPVDAICYWLIPILEPKVTSLTAEQRQELAVRLAAYADHLCSASLRSATLYMPTRTTGLNPIKE